jgi:hypothetical protein
MVLAGLLMPLCADPSSTRRSPVSRHEVERHPQLTDQAKRKILGKNLARLHGIDVEAKKAELGVPG